MTKTLSLTLLLLSSASLLVTGTSPAISQQAEEPRPVLSIIAEVEPGVHLTIPGTVEPRIETQFGFRILGRIVARNVVTGDLVKKGDVLAAIDPLALEFAVRSAQSDLANSQAQLVNAQATEFRQKSLFESRSGSQATFEMAEMERKTAEAAVAKAQANLAKAKEQLGYSRLQAEFDGVVTATSAEVGQVVAAGQSVVTVADPLARDAVIDVPEGLADQVQQGSVFQVSLQIAPEIHSAAIVREIAPEAESATRTRRTRLTLVDPPPALRLGSVITATAKGAEGTAIRLPASAIKTEAGKTLVWIVDETAKTVSTRPVTLGPSPAPGDPVTVLDGVRPGDRVVVAGVNKLEEGQTIRLDQETIN